LNTKIKIKRRDVIQHFSRAGRSFEEAGLLSHAASCYFTARNFTKAALVFEKMKQFN